MNGMSLLPIEWRSLAGGTEWKVGGMLSASVGRFCLPGASVPREYVDMVLIDRENHLIAVSSASSEIRLKKSGVISGGVIGGV